MRKFLTLAWFALATTAFAATLTITPNAATHNGGAPGHANGYIDGNGKLDITGMVDGSILVFDVTVNGLDYTLAGFEFRINYPTNMALLSTSNTDWNGNTGNIFRRVNGLVETADDAQFLPADASGNRTAGTVTNNTGMVRVGMLFTDAADRPNTGSGLIGQVYFELNKTATCNSANENVSVYATTAAGTDADIFANDQAQRVALNIAGSDLSANFGDTSVYVRGDWNKNGTRASNDALGAARCCLNGAAHATCSPGAPNWVGDANYHQAFDYNCSGAASSPDALGIARLCLGIVNRTQFKKLDFYQVDDKEGIFVVNSEKSKASLAHLTFIYDDIKVGQPFIDESAQKQGWMFVYELGGDSIEYILMNPKTEMYEIPTVQIPYSKLGDNARIALGKTFHQNTDYTEFTFTPSIEDQGVEGSNDRGKSEKQIQ